MTTPTETLASALRILAGDIQSPDNIPALCLMEAADRLEELHKDLAKLTALIIKLDKQVNNMSKYSTNYHEEEDPECCAKCGADMNYEDDIDTDIDTGTPFVSGGSWTCGKCVDGSTQ